MKLLTTIRGKKYLHFVVFQGEMSEKSQGRKMQIPPCMLGTPDPNVVSQ